MSCSVRTILLGLAMLTFAFAQTAQERNTRMANLQPRSRGHPLFTPDAD
jgi:hypothetical protein